MNYKQKDILVSAARRLEECREELKRADKIGEVTRKRAYAEFHDSLFSVGVVSGELKTYHAQLKATIEQAETDIAEAEELITQLGSAAECYLRGKNA